MNGGRNYAECVLGVTGSHWCWEDEWEVVAVCDGVIWLTVIGSMGESHAGVLYD